MAEALAGGYLKISVLIPTYRRPADLRRCLGALVSQIRAADEVVVVVRDTDEDSRQVIEELRASSRLPLKRVEVSRPGQMPAMNAGLKAVTGEVVCFTDDDAEPLPDWLALIEARFAADPMLGGLGGRDHVHFDGVRQPTRQVRRVGIIQWFGRAIGNHSQDAVGCREVDSLKGCNMAFRTDLPIEFDERLRGDAFQNEVAVCLVVKAAGRRLLYDPEVRINHFIAARQFGTGRSELSPQRLSNNSHNHLLVRMDHFPVWQKLCYLVYTFAVGDWDTPGLVRAVLMARGRPARTWRILAPSLRGKIAGLSTWLVGKRRSVRPGPMVEDRGGSVRARS